MLSRKYRLPATIKLREVFVIHTPFFSVKVGTNEFLYNRYGFIISKKVEKRATIRNRLRRRIRAFIEPLPMRISTETGKDMLFILKKEALLQTTRVLWLQMQETISQINTAL